MRLPTVGERDLMSVFDEEDNQIMKLIGLTGAGFAGLTVVLIVLAMYITG
jgi:hypothetical protein